MCWSLAATLLPVALRQFCPVTTPSTSNTRDLHEVSQTQVSSGHTHLAKEALWRNLHPLLGFPGGASGKEPTCQCRRCGFNPWLGKIPWRRAWQITPVFLPGDSHRQRSLADYSPWGHKESDMTEQLSIAQHNTYGTMKEHYITKGFFEFKAAAAAKSLQSCLTLCNPIDGTQARSLVCLVLGTEMF